MREACEKGGRVGRSKERLRGTYKEEKRRRKGKKEEKKEANRKTTRQGQK